MTSNVTRYEKQCDEIWQAMWQALWQYCLCKGLLVKVHLFLATYFCLQWRSKYFRPKLRSKSRYTSWHLTLWREGKVTAYYMNFENFEVKGNIYNDNQNGNIWRYLTRKNMTIFGDIWQGKIWEPVPPASPPRLQPGRSFGSLICGAQPATLDKLR